MKWQGGWFVLPLAALAAIAWSCNKDNGMDPPEGSGGQGGTSQDPIDVYVPPPPAPSDWCSTLKVLQDNCISCHYAGTPWATIPLAKFEDMYVRLPSTKLAYQAVKDRIHDDKAPMPPTVDRLTPVELATIDNWI